MDSIDHEILTILQEKARVPNTEVARQVGMAPSAVLERIRKLEKQGIIDGYEVRLNPTAMGRALVAFIQADLAPGADADAVGRALATIPDVQEVHQISGRDGYLIKTRVRDTEALADLVSRLHRDIPGLAGVHSTVVLRSIKETMQLPMASPRH